LSAKNNGDINKVSVNSYYGENQADRASRIKALFNRIAPRYDLINDIQSFGLHRFWKKKLRSLAAPKEGDSALDVCCGTGDIALSLAQWGATVTGVDFSAGMLEEARSRSCNESRIKFIEADALKLPFDDQSFDLVTIGYGLRNLTDFEPGLHELFRVLKPGGRLFVLDFGKPDNVIWRRAYFIYLEWIVPIFGKLFCGDAAAYSYILESLRNYPAQHGVAETMKSIGMERVKIHSILGGVMSINAAHRRSDSEG
jgi:ubiquinone/menaquinone biosynthesis methyltransferase